MYNKLVNKENKLAVIGLGYVGLPIALEFAKNIDVIGFDINEKRLNNDIVKDYYLIEIIGFLLIFVFINKFICVKRNSYHSR